MRNKIILFADNIETFLETKARSLEASGYQVLKAPTEARARELLYHGWAHLAILDIRLKDDYDENDVSGLVLAKEPALKAVPKIMFSVNDHWSYPREARRQRNGSAAAVDYLHKVDDQRGEDSLIEAVERAFEEHVKINWQLEISWLGINRFGLLSCLQTEPDTQWLVSQAEELEDLFRKLFFNKQQVRIERVLWEQSGRVALAINTFKKGEPPQGVLVVCSTPALMEQETERYRQSAPAVGENSTMLLSRAETTHFSGIAYTLANANLDQLSSLNELYRTGKEANFNVIVARLFQKTLHSWHPNQLEEAGVGRLDTLYRQRLGLVGPDLTSQVFEEKLDNLITQLPRLGLDASYAQGKLTLHLGTKTFTYPDPGPLLFHLSPIEQPVLLRNTSGLLMGENIFTDGREHVWVTDFFHAGLAPLYWNYTSLEATIRFDWLESTQFQQLHDAERYLVNLNGLDRRDTDGLDLALARPLRAIYEVRKLADLSNRKDYLAYQLGLFFHAAAYLHQTNLGAHYTSKELARAAHLLISLFMTGNTILGSGAKLTERTTTLKSSDSLQIDRENREVRLDGRKMQLAPKEFEVLMCLYERAGQLCRRSEIYERVQKEKFLNEEYQNSWINTNVGRLRRELEADPSNPRYLLTLPSVGYRLLLNPNEST